ncbi:MAG TPA: NAD(P)/FAD-dependent oxidoreductase [Humisphaera sp.]|jgi:flavin-dependent dehydrogenase|nr:NAD(P)/FAD-dependent oxidoreductase [Humisphaera sp.]
MQTSDTSNYDCLVIGGGPAGSTVATLVAEAGHRVLLIERGNFPRFHIGESLMPETYWTFKRLGMLPKLKASNFVKKYSVQFVNGSGKESQPFYFDEMNPHECSQTWQVVRSEFDRMMLDNAAEHGAQVWQNANVNEVIFAPANNGSLPRATGVVVTREGQAPVRLNAKVVVDATGTSALISKRLKIREPDPMLRKASIFAHYKGARRDAGKNEGATLVLATENQDGWFWYIPLPDDIASIGVVADPETLISGRGTPEQTLDEEIRRCPGLEGRMTNAVRVSPVHVLSDFTYRSNRPAGDGWVLVGDAFGFLDPIYSSGVFLALKSGEMAADCINEGLQKGDTSAAQLGKWGDMVCEGMHAIRKLVYAYYTRGFSFGQFMRSHPQFKKNLVDLLIGDVFRPEVNAIFEPMGKQVKLPEPVPLASR